MNEREMARAFRTLARLHDVFLVSTSVVTGGVIHTDDEHLTTIRGLCFADSQLLTRLPDHLREMTRLYTQPHSLHTVCKLSLLTNYRSHPGQLGDKKKLHFEDRKTPLRGQKPKPFFASGFGALASSHYEATGLKQ